MCPHHRSNPLRRFMLSALALAALVLPAAAQEPICREPNAAFDEFVQREKAKITWDEQSVRALSRELQFAYAQRHIAAVDLLVREAVKVFDRSFREHCKTGDLIRIYTVTELIVLTYCDRGRRFKQIGDAILCFAQVPPHE